MESGNSPFPHARPFFLNRRIRNFYNYYEEILQGMRAYSDEFGATLDFIGVDAFGSDFTLLDRCGDPALLTPSYRQDKQKRQDSLIDEIFGCYRLYQHNGNHSMTSDTLQQLLRMQQNNDPALDDPSAILFFADIFHYLLGAPACCEHSLASYSRFYDNREQRWDDEVIKAFNLPEGLKTKVVYCGERIGTVYDAIARDVGLQPGTAIVTPCSHDTSCAVLAVPDDADDWIFISSGSWSLLGTETASMILSEEAWRANMSNSSMPFRANMLKRNINGMWLMQECQRLWKKYSFDDLVALAESAPDNDFYIDVDNPRFFAPENMPVAIVDDVNVRYGVSLQADDAGSVTRICLQSLAMKYRYFTELIIRLTGKNFTKIHIVGGGGRNRMLNSLAASITGLPVISGVYEASVAGNLLLQAYGLGLVKDRAEIRQVVRNSFDLVETRPVDAEKWDPRYQKYLRDLTLSQ